MALQSSSASIQIRPIMVGHVMALSLSRNLVRLTSCAANDGHIFSVKLSHTYQHPRPRRIPHSSYRAIQVSPLRHSRLQAGLVGTKGLAGYSRTLPGRIHQPPVARGAASGQSGSAQMRAVIILGQTAPHSAPNSHVQLRTFMPSIFHEHIEPQP